MAPADDLPATIPHVDRDELWRKIQAGEPIVVVDALSPMSYAASHLPGAINMPPARVGEIAARRIPDLEAEVVVYCSGSTCDASTRVARRLVGLGYRNVGHFAGGKEEWSRAGLPLEGGRAAPR